MSNTYTQIHIQFVFAVKFRKAQILSTFKTELLKYITAIIQKHGHKMLSINSEPDHIHIFIGMRPTQSISELMKEVKASSSGWINARGFLPVRFQWQGGYGAFAYHKSQIKNVINYIERQEIHHLKRSFREEYLQLLQEHEIDYEAQYIFSEMV